MGDTNPSSSQKCPLHQRAWFQITVGLAAVVGMVFQITGPIPKEWLASIPNGLSVVFQKISAFLAAYGVYFAIPLVALLAFWKRELLLKTLRLVGRFGLYVYAQVLAFLLSPAVHKILAEQKRQEACLLILSAKYGAAGPGAQNGFCDVTEILRSKIADGQLELIVCNDALGGDPVYGTNKKLTVDYLYAGKRLSKNVDENQPLKLP